MVLLKYSTEYMLVLTILYSYLLYFIYCTRLYNKLNIRQKSRNRQSLPYFQQKAFSLLLQSNSTNIKLYLETNYLQVALWKYCYIFDYDPEKLCFHDTVQVSKSSFRTFINNSMRTPSPRNISAIKLHKVTIIPCNVKLEYYLERSFFFLKVVRNIVANVFWTKSCTSECIVSHKASATSVSHCCIIDPTLFM